MILLEASGQKCLCRLIKCGGITWIDPWFLREIEAIVREEAALAKGLPGSAAEWKRRT